MSQSTPHTPPAGSAERTALLEAARGPVESELSRPVRFAVQQLREAGDWAFLKAQMQGADGAPIGYDGTRYAEAAQHGYKSKTYAALLQRDGGHWRVRAYVVGPTDPAWMPWAAQYGADPALFAPDPAAPVP